MLRVVLDTNVIVSGTIQKAGPSCQILNSWRSGQLILITSNSLIQEAERVLHYPHIRQKYHLSEKEIDFLIAELKKQAILTLEKLSLQIIKDDPDDDKLIVAAIEGKADYIISGDPHLKNLQSYQHIKIISPAEFVKTLL